MRLTDVPVTVAIERMRLFGQLSADELRDAIANLLAGHNVFYAAYASTGEFIGYTLLWPESQPPIATVTEINS